MKEREKTTETKPAPTGVGVEPLVLWASHFLRFLGLTLKDIGLFIIQSVGMLLATPFLVIGLPFMVAWEVWLKDIWTETKP